MFMLSFLFQQLKNKKQPKTKIIKYNSNKKNNKSTMLNKKNP